MNEGTKSIMQAGTMGCSLRMQPACENTYVRELFFTYNCSSKCKNCPHITTSDINMPFEVAAWAVSTAEDTAWRRRMDALRIQMAGGDPLTRFEELKAFAGWMWEMPWRLPVSLGFTTDGSTLTGEAAEWLERNRERIHMSYCWNGSHGRERWENSSILRSGLVDTVFWCLDRESLEHFREETKLIMDAGKRVCVEYTDIDSWKDETMKKYLLELCAVFPTVKQRREFLGTFYSCAADRHNMIDAVDTDGRRYHCRYLSPERMIYSSLKHLDYQALIEDGVCPAGKSILMRRKKQAQLQKLLDILVT